MTETPPNAGRATPPNLLLVVVDCLRADRCPTTDLPDGLAAWPKLVRSGTVMNQTISSASWTPVCFASLLAAQYSFAHGVRTIRGPAIDPAVATLATVLQQAGYSTHAFFTGPMLDVLGMNRGFDEYNHRLRDRFVYDDWGQWFQRRFDEIVSAPKPWFVLLHLFEVHCPRQTNGISAKEHSIEQYDIAWRQLDGWIAELMDRTPDNTLISLTADHGESILRRADHHLAGKIARKLHSHVNKRRRPNDWRRHGYHVFDEIMRIPWAISGPDVPSEAIVNDPVRQVDIAPTLLDLLGLQMPAATHGRSIVPLLRGEAMEESPAYIESGCDDPLREWHGLRFGGWKYAEHPRWSPNVEAEPTLFDLADDPDERRNVVHKYPDRAIEMRKRLDEIVYSRIDQSPAGQELSDDEQAQLAEQLKALGYI